MILKQSQYACIWIKMNFGVTGNGLFPFDCKLHCKWNAFRDIYHVHYKCMMGFIRIIVCSVYQENISYMYMF